MAKLRVHPTTYDRELNQLIREGLTPRQAATCLKHLRRDKNAEVRITPAPDSWMQLLLNPPIERDP